MQTFVHIPPPSHPSPDVFWLANETFIRFIWSTVQDKYFYYSPEQTITNRLDYLVQKLAHFPADFQHRVLRKAVVCKLLRQTHCFGKKCVCILEAQNSLVTSGIWQSANVSRIVTEGSWACNVCHYEKTNVYIEKNNTNTLYTFKNLSSRT
jgi:hypothetical protein